MIETPPRRSDLETNEDASWGYDFIDFVDYIGAELDPWQKRLSIHLGELDALGRPIYDTAIIMVPRQNGKTVWTRLLIAYWMTQEQVPTILGTSSDRGEAKRSWDEVVTMMEGNEALAETLPGKHTTASNGYESFFNSYGSKYRFAAPNRRAGRGGTLHRWICDELREHRNRDCWNAAMGAMAAAASTEAGALAVCISNEGDENATVLHTEADAAELFAQTGEGNPRTYFAAWRADSDADPEDVEQLIKSNPGLGHRVSIDWLIGKGKAAKAAGGRDLADHKTEHMCVRVDRLDAAIRPEDWAACGVRPDRVVDITQHRRRLVLALDIAHEDAAHATLTAAAVIDGATHLQVVKQWQGHDARAQLRRDLPGLLAKARPRKLLIQSGGPAAAIAAELQQRSGWPAGVRLEMLASEDVVRACMGLEEQAAARQLQHPFDPLLDKHVALCERLPQGDGWRFSRRGPAPIDAAYAGAFAVHGARALPVLAEYRSAYDDHS
ncbi:hypothetical protein [Actinoplanes awajinensis]|uniref:Terminase n=1 Tax=Actinoplanes awajinensis subsp. mycoplanecinus TaxID=135947 RepID=A0A101J8R9_9ACTN|nr:hypothetical protein [Actinoplanes awajinensis]KUL22348.1 hypothetical protein ADL15_48305 [Actinoplanes awajinensis subsp. mycoplanecinus]